jgi:hypothetical protein
MSVRIVLALAALFLSACVAVPSKPASDLELVDLTDDFSAFWDDSHHMEDAARAAAFKAHFEPLVPGYYAREKVGPFNYNDFILKALKSYPEQRTGIQEVSRRFAHMMKPARLSFEAEFGPMGEMPPMYLLHSLGEMDGGVKNYQGAPTMFFGADVIARNHLKHGIQPFFHHELFHAFHRRNFDLCDEVWCGLWSEGLAVYVAERLNPNAHDAQLLLVNPVPLRQAVESNRKDALCGVLGQLDSTETGNLFSGGGKSMGALPARVGYYIGYLVAAEAGKNRSLRELGNLPNNEVRPLVEGTLRELGGC